MDRRFPVAYNVLVDEKLTGAELKARNLGGCDAVIIHSIIYPADGSRSEVIIGHDGRTDTDLSDEEMFKSWAMLAHRLAQSTTLGDGRKMLAQFVHATLRKVIAGKCDHPPQTLRLVNVEPGDPASCWVCGTHGVVGADGHLSAR